MPPPIAISAPKLYSRSVGQGQKITQHFAIVLDREIKSWPSIDWEQYPNGIGGSNGAQITGIADLGFSHSTTTGVWAA